MNLLHAVVLILGIVISIALVVRSTRPLAQAVALIIGTSTFVPMVSTPTEMIGVFGIAAVLIAVIAYFRADRPQRTASSLYLLLALSLVLYSQLARFIGNQLSVREWVYLGVAASIVLLATRLKRADIPALILTLNIFVAFHLFFAMGELWLRFQPIWPMGNGLFELGHRPNFLFPNLPGRPMTSFAHPIPMATFALSLALMNSYLLLHRRRLAVVGMGLALALLLLSGTRSAVLAFIVGLAVLAVSSRRIGSALKATLLFFVLLVGLVAATNSSGALAIIGLGDGFEDSLSYKYRALVLASAWGILDQPALNVLFGWGGNREEIFRQGVIDGAQYGVLFFDNQFIAMAAMFGLVGLSILVACFALVIWRGGEMSKSLVGAFAVMAFSFDFLQYLTPALLFLLAVGAGGVYADRKIPGATGRMRGRRIYSSTARQRTGAREKKEIAKWSDSQNIRSTSVPDKPAEKGA